MLPGWTRRFAGILLVVIAVVLLIRYTAEYNGGVPWWSGLIREGFYPMQKGISAVVQETRGVLAKAAGLGGMQAEIDSLQKQIATLEMENNQLRENCRELERLRSLLGFKTSNPQYELLAARVIGRSFSNWFSTLTIDAGSKDGVAKNMVVITPQGVVGRISAVGPYSSEVLLITDPQGPAGAVVLVQDTRIPGVVEGVGDGTGMLHMKHIPYDANIQEGQLVVTSGLGTVFPAGLPIGRVQRVEREAEPSALQQDALIAPAVDFNRLEEVLIITRIAGGRQP